MTIKPTYEGVVDVCAHRVTYWYRLEQIELTELLQRQLDNEAEERAKASIIEGFVSGELCYLHGPDIGKEVELRGWWEIDRD